VVVFHGGIQADADLSYAGDGVEAILDGAIERRQLRGGVARRLRVDVDDIAVGGFEVQVGVLELVGRRGRAAAEWRRSRWCECRCAEHRPDRLWRRTRRGQGRTGCQGTAAVGCGTLGPARQSWRAWGESV